MMSKDEGCMQRNDVYNCTNNSLYSGTEKMRDDDDDCIPCVLFSYIIALQQLGVNWMLLIGEQVLVVKARWVTTTDPSTKGMVVRWLGPRQSYCWGVVGIS